ncbi:hypothetical protein [Pelagimonas varians]|uniref:Uncharacterized protein n=1 Tax=Pelagimonas varians TaxID=696760 RepID=A0A238K2E4_9RHOB|nr:hypothetical protein [Pelagimonas varians]PYG27050.1 hypothetical protein C8N36_11873 [Pelagimonas varians]SMX37078.1 hypothetical protein PEV8663_00908 [Pelagimonas varians]
MTPRIFLAVLVLAAPMAMAQEALKPDCDAQAALVMDVVNDRVDGVRKGKARRVLRAALDRTAADMLADWVYALPEEQLTDEIGKTWKTQCAAM